MGYLNIVLRLTIWFLLTDNFSVENTIIGVAVAFLLPGNRKTLGRFSDWLRAMGEIAVAIPQAYKEAIEMIFRPHNYEEVTLERVKAGRSPGLIFLDVFLITFTPKTIVLRYRDQGWYEVHRVTRRKNS